MVESYGFVDALSLEGGGRGAGPRRVEEASYLVLTIISITIDDLVCLQVSKVKYSRLPGDADSNGRGVNIDEASISTCSRSRGVCMGDG